MMTKKTKLSAKEFEILKFFVEHAGDVITRDMLLDKIWGYETYPVTRTVDNYILSLVVLAVEDIEEVIIG